MINPNIKQLSVDVETLQNHPRNIRQGDVGAIAESLKENGQYRPIVVQKSTNYVLAGNHTLKAAKALGWKKIAATFVDVDDERALRILLADNRTNDLASYDENALVELLKELADTEAGLVGTLYTGDDLDDILFKIDHTTGNAFVGADAVDLKEKYYDKNIKSLILVFDEEQHKEVISILNNLGTLYGTQNYSETIFHLVKKHEND